ncbi:MAG: SDR family NAD(P)-dependent oxidoreductase, partial [Pseudomonadota bacterium]
NNAGLMGSGTVLDDVDEWQRLMTVMVDGPHRLMHLLVPGMVERRYGRVVNLSSGWGSFAEGLAGPGAYGVAKAALNALTVAAARRKPRNVKINSMCPGWVHTDMGGPNAPRTPKEGADTAIWLATLDDKGPSGGFFRDRKPIAW